jgi:hypothetical protein
MCGKDRRNRCVFSLQRNTGSDGADDGRRWQDGGPPPPADRMQTPEGGGDWEGQPYVAERPGKMERHHGGRDK